MAGLLILLYILLFIIRIYVIIYYKRGIIDAAVVAAAVFFFSCIKLTVSVDYRRHVSPRELRTTIYVLDYNIYIIHTHYNMRLWLTHQTVFRNYIFHIKAYSVYVSLFVYNIRNRYDIISNIVK